MKFRGGMAEMIRQASRVQRKIEKRKEELKEEQFPASAGNDQVKVIANGEGQLLSIEIQPELIKNESLDMVQDLIVAATNAALTKSKEFTEKEIEGLTNGLNIPGL